MNIKNAYENAAQTTQIYLRTHERAVIDNNGTTAETKFGMITDLVNQKQMEVGAVPSDLAPTPQSTKWVTSGGIFDVLNRTVNVPSENWIQGSFTGAIDGTTYANYASWDYPYFIPLSNAGKVCITTGAKKAMVAMVTNRTMVKNGQVPFATGWTGAQTLTANNTFYMDVPDDAAYIFCAQKISENWQFPTDVVCFYSAQDDINILRADMNSGLSELETKKQDKQYLVDLSSANIVPQQDDINSYANTQRATLRMQRVYKGDVLNAIKPTGYPNATGKMLVRAFNKAKGQIAQTDWVSTYSVTQDGYVTIVVNSGTNNSGTTQFLLDTLTQVRTIETITQQFLEQKWDKDNDALIYNRVLQSNNRKFYQFSGESPLNKTLRWVQLSTLAANQSMAIYNNYMFLFAKGAAFTVYDFYQRYTIASVSAILGTNAFECNAMWFSNEFYDQADKFPIIYGQAIYTAPYICGFRIQENNGVWSITKVHEIVFSNVSVGNLIALNQRDDRLVSLGNNFVTFQRPTYAASTDGVSTLTSSDIISTVAKEDSLVFGQDCSMIGDIAVGINNSGEPNNTLFGINVKTGKTVFTFTPPSPWGEGEGVEWYCGRLYVTDVNGRFFELTFP